MRSSVFLHVHTCGYLWGLESIGAREKARRHFLWQNVGYYPPSRFVFKIFENIYLYKPNYQNTMFSHAYRISKIVVWCFLSPLCKYLVHKKEYRMESTKPTLMEKQERMSETRLDA